MPRGDKDWIMNYKTILPEKKIMTIFKEKVHSLFSVSNERIEENITLLSLSQLLLSKMTKVEVEETYVW